MGGLGAPEIILILVALTIWLLPAYLGYVEGSKRSIGSAGGLLLGLFLSFLGLIIVYLMPLNNQQQFFGFPNQPPSAADELLKYKKLLDSGAITEQEYNDQKSKILNSGR